MSLCFEYHPNIFSGSNVQNRTRMPVIAASSIPMTLTIKWEDGLDYNIMAMVFKKYSNRTVPMSHFADYADTVYSRLLKLPILIIRPFI